MYIIRYSRALFARSIKVGRSYMSSKILSVGHIGKHYIRIHEPSLVPVCSACGLVREGGGSSGQERWITKRTYVESHGRTLADSHLTHTYCPTCFTDFMERVRPSSRSIALAR